MGKIWGLKVTKQSWLWLFSLPPHFFRFSCLMAMGKVLRKRCVMEQQTVTSQAVEGTWFRKGGYGQLRGEWVHFAIFPQSRKTWNLTRTPNKVNPVFLVRRLYKRGGRQVERRGGGGRGVEGWSPYQWKSQRVSVKQFRFVLFMFMVISLNSSTLDNGL